MYTQIKLFDLWCYVHVYKVPSTILSLDTAAVYSFFIQDSLGENIQVSPQEILLNLRTGIILLHVYMDIKENMHTTCSIEKAQVTCACIHKNVLVNVKIESLATRSTCNCATISNITLEVHNPHTQ